MLVAAILVSVVVILLVYKIFWGKTLTIPGPTPLPLIGNVLQIDPNKLMITFHRMAEKYGGVFKVQLFNTDFVVVNDFESIHQVLVEKSSHFDSRPQTFRFDFLAEKSDVVSMDSGPELKGRRKTIQRYLKQFGDGIQRIEEVTTDATTSLIKKLDGQNGQPVDIKKMFFECLTDLISVLLIGDTLNEKDLNEMIDTVMAVNFVLGSNLPGQLLDSFPFLRYFPNRRFKKMCEINNRKRQYINQWINDKPEVGFINHVVNMTQQEQKANFVSEITEKENVFFQFFGAGTLTTSTTLTCLMNVLCHKPSIQKALQEEVATHIGSSRPPKMSDRDNMPYHRATILEIGRFATIAPLGVPHLNKIDAYIGEYKIPKETIVLTNLWALHHDEKFWGDPFEFRPERYLDENGDLVPVDHPNRKHTMPFGAGNRVCVGEIFALSRMFLFIARLMQHFTILPETTIAAQPSYDPRDMTSEVLAEPPAFKVRFKAL